MQQQPLQQHQQPFAETVTSAACLTRSRAFFAGIVAVSEAPVPSPPSCPPANVIWQKKKLRRSLGSRARMEELPCGEGNIITVPVCQAADMEKMVFVMFLLFAVLSPLYKLAPLVSGLSVLLFLGFFISLSVCGGSPPPHILIFFV